MPGFHECILNNNRYSIGEEFHPVVEVNGTRYEAVCFRCVCQPVSTVSKYPGRLTIELHPRLCVTFNSLAPSVPPPTDILEHALIHDILYKLDSMSGETWSQECPAKYRMFMTRHPAPYSVCARPTAIKTR